FIHVTKIWGFLLCTYILYTLSTTGMYIFSMPRLTAMNLGTIDRYQRTILIFCYYILFCTVFDSLMSINFVIIRKDAQSTGKRTVNSSLVSASSKPIDLFDKYLLARSDQQNATKRHINAARSLTIACILVVLTFGWVYQNNGTFRTFLHRTSGTYLHVRNKLEPALKAADVPQRAKCLYIRNEKDGVYKVMLAFLLGTSWNDMTQVSSDGSLEQLDIALQDNTWIIIDADDTQKGNIKTWLSLHRGNDHIVIVE
ncbi:MAG: hypothetical protein ACI4WX_07090, partial [Aristaeellaceae bacterium]